MSMELQPRGSEPLQGRVELTRLGVLSVAKIAAAVYAIVAFIPGVAVALGFVVAISTSGNGPTGIRPIFGLGLIIISPIFYGMLGFIFGAISAWVYNFTASKIGGVVIEARPLRADGIP